MLKNIPKIISPQLMKTMMEMGHGDELVLAGGNFPSASHANILLPYQGVEIAQLLPAVLQFFPLDEYVDISAMVIEVVKGDGGDPKIWGTYRTAIEENDKCTAEKFSAINRAEFYERTKNAYAIVATGDTTMYSTIILRKGVC